MRVCLRSLCAAFLLVQQKKTHAAFSLSLSRRPPLCAQEDTLRVAFEQYGTVQHVKLIKDKGGEGVAAWIAERRGEEKGGGGGWEWGSGICTCTD